MIFFRNATTLWPVHFYYDLRKEVGVQKPPALDAAHSVRPIYSGTSGGEDEEFLSVLAVRRSLRETFSLR